MDPERTSRSSLRTSQSCDDLSLCSSRSFIIHERISSEIKKKKDRRDRSRERIRKLGKEKLGMSEPSIESKDDQWVVYTDSSNANKIHYQSELDDSLTVASNASSIRSIMTVRTQSESLRGGSVSEMKKLRRQITIKVKGRNSETSSSLGDASVSDDTKRTESSRSMDEKSLSFSTVCVREYPVIPGVNPSVSCGPPVELGWSHTEGKTICIDKFEDFRGSKRRLQCQMRMPKGVRKELLLFHGSTKKMMKESSKIAKKHRWW
jgi:hypothetical protein